MLALGFAGSLLLWPGTSASASPLPPGPVEVSPSSSESPSEPEPSPESPEVPVVEETVEPPPAEEPPPPEEPPVEEPPAVTVVQLSEEDRILIGTGFSLVLLVTTAGTVRLLTK